MSVTVGELRAMLEQFEDDLPVVLSSDPEGNAFLLLAGADPALYDPEEQVVYPTNEEVDEDDELSEDDRAPEGTPPAVLLYPH